MWNYNSFSSSNSCCYTQLSTIYQSVIIYIQYALHTGHPRGKAFMNYKYTFLRLQQIKNKSENRLT